MGNYHPILMQIDKQTKKNMLSSKVTKAEMIVGQNFKMGRRRRVEN
jgi:hypothetical protein